MTSKIPPIPDTGKRWLKAVSFWISIGTGAMFFGTAAVAGSVLFILTSQKRPLHFLGVYWAKSVIACNPWWKFVVRGREHLPPKDTAVVYVSNHLSQTDILAIFSIGMDFRWLSKDSVFKIPFLGWGMSAIGYVPIVRGDRNSSKMAMERSLQHLKRGTPMVFFPEGTRSRDGHLKAFKPGAFVLAHNGQVPIVPITLQGTERLLPKGSLIPGDAAVEIKIHQPLKWQEGETPAEMMERCFEQMNAALPDEMKANPS